MQRINITLSNAPLNISNGYGNTYTEQMKQYCYEVIGEGSAQHGYETYMASNFNLELFLLFHIVVLSIMYWYGDRLNATIDAAIDNDEYAILGQGELLYDFTRDPLILLTSLNLLVLIFMVGVKHGF